jgi:hypothetical protein
MQHHDGRNGGRERQAPQHAHRHPPRVSATRCPAPRPGCAAYRPRSPPAARSEAPPTARRLPAAAAGRPCPASGRAQAAAAATPPRTSLARQAPPPGRDAGPASTRGSGRPRPG